MLNSQSSTNLPPSQNPTSTATDSEEPSALTELASDSEIDVDRVQLSLNDAPISVRELDTTLQINLDGQITESIWHELPIHNDFYVTRPETLERASNETRVRMFYTDDGLYVAVEMEQESTTLVKRLSAPDQGFLTRDYVSFTLDTSGEAKYGYWFQLNLGDSRADGTIQAERQFSSSWDGAWYGNTSETEYGWSAEFYIPWSIVLMPRTDGPRKMGIYVSRSVAHLGERHSWPALTFSTPRFISLFQPLELENVLPRRQLSFFPYAASTHRRVIETDNQKVGADVYWRPTTNFQVTAAVNPDFGTVEPDAVVINLSAIETFFPEKRLFFLEGQEIFVATSRGGWGGSSSVTLLHTRRIGQRPFFPELPADATFDPLSFRQPADLAGAAKLTGQTGALRYGVLTAAEKDSRFHGTYSDGTDVTVTQDGRDFGVARVLYEKTTGGYRGIGFLTTKLQHPSHTAATHGVDLQFMTESGQLQIESQLVMSDVQGQPRGFGGFVDTRYQPTQNMSHELIYENFDDKVDLNDLGFLGRNDYQNVRYRFRYRDNEPKRFRETYTRIGLDQSWNSNGEIFSRQIEGQYEITFENLTRFRIELEYKPETIDDQNSFGNGSFTQVREVDLDWRYQSDSSKQFYYVLRGSLQTDYLDGLNRSLSASLVLRPSGRFSSFFSIGGVQRDAWLLFRGNRRFVLYETKFWYPSIGIDLFINAHQQFRFDLQWSGMKAYGDRVLILPETGPDLVKSELPPEPSDDFAISRLNLQLRYHWVLAPMSDLFFVYTKNASLPNPIHLGFGEIFRETLGHATSEQIAFKVRYHLGAK